MMNTLLIILSSLVVIVVALPMIRHSNWKFRVFEYLRIQKLIAVIILVVIWTIVYSNDQKTISLIYLITLVILGIFLIYQIFPFTILAKKMIADNSCTDLPSIKLMVINVYQYNTEYQQTIDLIKKVDPDMFFLVETDQKWADSISIFKESYTYQIEKPLDNTYGLLFYSKLEIIDPKIHYLIKEEIPSIELDLKLSSGQMIKVYGIHPEPPVPSENPDSTERDAEILKVGKKVKELSSPCIVIGDLNDVGWSYSSELFLKISGMLDLRRGRGLYNTFHAKYFFLRWPLDHIFVSEHFTLGEIKRYRNVGSDHFPIGCTLYLEKSSNNEQLDVCADDLEKMDEKIADAEK
ncbi:endonuclease/exonuclease/phosphatase family protein [Belliella kenyensis]|uniref:Endonuclease/exonuclease/phosphatase family protein n=1 Tax=Belliella kenyensis TaxID=1472724 RepID=A0ABV8EMF9_9BACT|nr:endonuclease/exonuclease/phosphatase family protein [Belliella kenyensis]MCH7403510.1 endonuclease/exonuclease/phosphatase family protein [Belliella kenyensis]MDN3604968.1 endonuclease/exonuclease/phosphatase family protein [Belliella kenyensis]